MIILEAPYVSSCLTDWLISSHHPVLANDFACELAATGLALNLIQEPEAIELLNSDERTYAISENALSWILEHSTNEGLCRGISLCKDKAATRRALASVDPGVFFEEHTLDELRSIDPTTLPYPVVVKPNVGFVSIGVHTATSPEEWTRALSLLEEEMGQDSIFPTSVVNASTFVVEGYLTGQEYAVDLYYDKEGAPVILNVMQHDFANAADTSDHCYFTSKALATGSLPSLEAWFARANEALRLKDFCVHVELRVAHDEGQDPLDAMQDLNAIHAIEFNPMRFAGFCATDLSYFAFGFRTYECYLENTRPDWDALDGGEGRTGFICTEPPSGWVEGSAFDYERFFDDLTLGRTLDNIRDERRMDPSVQSLVCFPIFQMPAGPQGEDLRRFALDLNVDTYLI